MSILTNFKITGLHGYKDLDIKFKNNRLILVGENGSGKTSVLRILYYFLTCNWIELCKYNFKKISLKIDDKTFSLDYSTLKSNVVMKDKLIKMLPPPLSKKVINAWDNGNIDDFDYLLARYLSPRKYYEYRNYIMHDQMSLFKDDAITEEERENLRKKKSDLDALRNNISKSINFKILYLPTYRRIERELEAIFQDYEVKERINDVFEKNMRDFNNSDKNHIELIQFGMNDVEDAKDKTLNELKEFHRTQLNKLTLEYLDDIVNQKYKEINVDKISQTSEYDVERVLARISETILSKNTKQKLKKAIDDVKQKSVIIKDEYTRVLCHYFIKLLDFQEKLQEKESRILNFCKVCNDYINDKEFIYESSSFEFMIRLKNDTSKTIKFSQLSSGEKQIVSLFSFLYLLQQDDYFIIIDEPELSLSVIWQKKFLVDIQKTAKCKGLFAVTHSPFIYQNELDEYTHGLGEFKK